LHHRPKIHKDRSNRRGDIAIIVIFKMAAATILDFQKVELLTDYSLSGDNVRKHAEFYQNRSNGCRDMAIFAVFKMAAVRYLGFVGRLLGLPAMTTWWSLSLCQIWLKSIQ